MACSWRSHSPLLWRRWRWLCLSGYNLMSSSRTVAKGGNCLGPDGKPDGASCLASAWADDYFATIKHFIEETGFDMIET